VTFSAVIDKSGFEAGLDARDDGFVDIAFLLFLGGRFNVEVNEFLTINNGDTEFLGLCRVKKHAFHKWAPTRKYRGAPCAGSDELVVGSVLHGRSVKATKWGCLR
jgi:hypothetical protein